MYKCINEAMGLYSDSVGGLHLKLQKCMHCGAEDVMSSDTDTQLCEECHSRYKYFFTQRRNANAMNKHSTLLKYYNTIVFYMSLRDEGVLYKVPKGLDDEYHKVIELLRITENAEKPQRVRKAQSVGAKTCKGCGALVEEGYKYGNGVRCGDCESRYKRYQYFLRYIGILSQQECEEFNELLDEYKELGMRGWWMPDVRQMRGRVNKRLEELQVLWQE